MLYGRSRGDATESEPCDSGLILATALTALSATSAHAEKWCGYAAHANAVIECGYSTAAECESAMGNGGMCFVDPDYALNSKRAMPMSPAKLHASRG